MSHCSFPRSCAQESQLSGMRVALSAFALSFQPPSLLGPFPIKQSPAPHMTVQGEEDLPPELCGEQGSLLVRPWRYNHNGTAGQDWVGGWMDLLDRVGARRWQSPALLGGPMSISNPSQATGG